MSTRGHILQPRQKSPGNKHRPKEWRPDHPSAGLVLPARYFASVRKTMNSTAESGRCRQRKDPGHRNVAHGAELQPAFVRHHGVGHARGKYVRCRNRQPEAIRRHDGAHGDKLGRRALTIGQVLLADLLAPITTIPFQPTMVPSPSG
jgi:hypothetical protein